MGINFATGHEAFECQKALEDFQIILSDFTIVQCRVHLYISEILNSLSPYQIDIYPEGMQYVTGNVKLATKPFFYEIRSHLYSTILNLEYNFTSAFFEFEGSDFIKDTDIAQDINLYGIGKTQEGDRQAASLFNFEPTYYDSKRFCDGLIISEEIYNSIITDRDHFSVFKPGYFWLPL